MEGGQPRRIRVRAVGGWIAASAAWLGAVAGAMPLSAQTEPTESVEAVAELGDADRVMWTAAALERLLDRRDYPSFLLISAIGRGTTDDVQPEDLDRLVDALSLRPVDVWTSDAGGDEPAGAGDAALDACRSERSVAAGTLCSMERLATLAPRTLAGRVTEEGARLVALSLPSVGAGGLAGSAALALDPLPALGENALENAWWRARSSVAGTSTGPALDQVLTKLVGIPPRATAEEVLDQAPRLKALVGSHSLLGILEPREASAGAAHDGFRSFLSGRVPSASDAAVARPLGAIPSGLDWASGRSFVYLAARSAELSGAGSAAAERMRVLGGVAADLRREAASFPATLAALGRDLATATLSGNVVALASRVTSFFRGSPGALGSDAARDVRALREGLDGMRSELTIGMGTIDRSLEELLTEVDERFSELERLVEANGRSVRADLASLHDDVVALGARLDRMDTSIRSYVRDGFDREHARTLVRCLEHRERYLPPYDDLAFGVFAECLADFRSRAVTDARDALLVDQSTPVDDLSLIAALADRSLPNLAHRLPLLARTAAERFGYPGLFANARLANAVEWAVAAEAYVTLLHQWPDHAVAVSAEDLDAMRAVGLDLQRALRAISEDAVTGEASPLLDRVAAYYAERLEEVDREADSLACRHRQQRLLRVAPETVLAGMERVDGSGPELDVPPFIAAALPDAVRTAAVLGLEDVELTYRLRQESSVSRANFRRRFLFFGRRHDRFTHTRVTIDVSLRVRSVGMVARFRAAGPYVLVRTDEIQGDESSDRVASTAVHVDDPFARFLALDWPYLHEDREAWVIEPTEQRVVDDLELRIDEELRRYATVGLDSVFTAVCSDDPRLVRLSAEDRASALTIRSALNGLSAARSLLEAYLLLAAAGTIGEDPAAEVLSATPALLDRRSLCVGLARGESPLRMVWLEEGRERRLEELRAQLRDVLPRRGAGGEVATLVDATLARLDAAARVQRVRAMVATAR